MPTRKMTLSSNNGSLATVHYLRRQRRATTAPPDARRSRTQTDQRVRSLRKEETPPKPRAHAKVRRSTKATAPAHPRRAKSRDQPQSCAQPPHINSFPMKGRKNCQFQRRQPDILPQRMPLLVMHPNKIKQYFLRKKERKLVIMRINCISFSL